ncbi:hypothetical protein AMJ80_06030 [bacterium SM23_31]|nr:MAG: hypothetical protein AMJ80_06030 [bacterium SM23_31]
MFSGVFPALTTPYEDGKVSFYNFVRNLERYDQYDLAGYVVLGSTGETVLLDDTERISLVKACRATVPDNKKIIVGTGRESTHATIEFTNRVGDLGADAGLVVTPCYYRGKMSADILTAFYTEVADKVNIPIFIYNVPKFTGIQLPFETVEQTMNHLNVIGIKDSSGNIGYLEEIVNICPQDFSVFQGSGSVLYPSLLMGAHGGILALADFAPGETAAIYKAVKNNELEEGKKIQIAIAAANNRIVGSYSVPGIKYAVDLVGFCGGDPRPPLKPVNEETKNDIKQILLDAGILKTG